jgi:hypothetical protein
VTDECDRNCETDQKQVLFAVKIVLRLQNVGMSSRTNRKLLICFTSYNALLLCWEECDRAPNSAPTLPASVWVCSCMSGVLEVMMGCVAFLG